MGTLRNIAILFQNHLHPDVPPDNGGPTTYPLAKLTDDDKMYLLRMELAYRQALRAVPGAHALFEDILTDEAGRTVADMGGMQRGGAALGVRVNTVINDADRLPHVYQWNPAAYSGPLKDVLGALIRKKLRG